MLVLASASPRRQELLRNAGISFAVEAADIDEKPLKGESARACAERLAREKAQAVWRRRPQDVVLGADTVVVVEGEILGKPEDDEDAARMLRLLSGRVHEVITGVAVVTGSQPPLKPKAGFHPSPRKARGLGTPGLSGAPARLAPSCESRVPSRNAFGSRAGNNESNEVKTASETTLVTMNAMSDDEILEYVATGEPMDKAGAYAIQGRASRWIPRIEGDYSNVVGLPVPLVCSMLREIKAL